MNPLSSQPSGPLAIKAGSVNDGKDMDDLRLCEQILSVVAPAEAFGDGPIDKEGLADGL
jgi:hypothetical protein